MLSLNKSKVFGFKDYKKEGLDVNFGTIENNPKKYQT